MSESEMENGAQGTDSATDRTSGASDQPAINAITCGAAVSALSRGPSESAPSGVNGIVAVCKCGAGLNAAGTRCAGGHVLVGNTAALLVGPDSARFWREMEDAHAEIRRSAIADAGHAETDAPRALAIIADGLAQAVLIRDSAFSRTVKEGGPLTSSARARRAYTVWESASASVERHVRILGIKRAPRDGDLAGLSAADYLKRARSAATRQEGTEPNGSDH